MPKLLKITSFLFLCNIGRKKWLMKLGFRRKINMNVSCKLLLWFLIGMIRHSQSSQNSKFVMSFKYLRKEVRYEGLLLVYFDSMDNFDNLEFHRVLLMDMIKSNKFAISQKNCALLWCKTFRYHSDSIRGSSHVCCCLFSMLFCYLNLLVSKTV